MNIMCPNACSQGYLWGVYKSLLIHEKVYLCWEGFHLPIMPKLQVKPTLHIGHDLKKSLAQFKILQYLFTPT